MHGRSDDELYSLYLSGDNAAYDELMLRYGDSITVFLNGYLHNVHDAEDLMIEAFARIMVKKPLIKVGGFKAYLFKTA
ncbi:MAG: sigma-70 family RNA polymerase sigma factor, partial [Firmicutes bacterium]|nr:sigma-70 family RNA polymerase sigma factor [Bacillota bacterium]